MVETKRTSTDLLTAQFQDGQGANSLSAQKLRDLIASMKPAFCRGVLSGNATETVIGTIDQFEAINGTFVDPNVEEEMNFNISGGVITYTGTPDVHVDLVSNIAVLTASNNQVVSFQWFLNGTTPLDCFVDRKVSTGADIGALAVNSDTPMSNGDTVQLKVTNRTSASNVTAQDVYMFAKSIFI